MTEKVTDDMLMAFADNEIDEASAAELRARLERDPELSRRLDRFVRSRDAVRAAFGEVLREVPPPGLVAAVREYRPAEAVPAPGRWFAGVFDRVGSLPLAASVALAAGIGGYLIGFQDEPAADRALLASLDAAFAELAAVPAGDVAEVGDTYRGAVVASYRADAGACRVVQLRSRSGELLDAVGCLHDEGWRTVVVLPQSVDNAYVLAEDAAADAVDTFVESLGAQPMEAAEERDLIARAWRQDGQRSP